MYVAQFSYSTVFKGTRNCSKLSLKRIPMSASSEWLTFSQESMLSEFPIPLRLHASRK